MARNPRSRAIAMLFCLSLWTSLSEAAEPRFTLQPGDRIAYIGNTLTDQMQHQD